MMTIKRFLILILLFADRVFDLDSSTEDVYDQLVKPIVGQVMQGFNGRYAVAVYHAHIPNITRIL